MSKCHADDALPQTPQKPLIYQSRYLTHAYNSERSPVKEMTIFVEAACDLFLQRDRDSVVEVVKAGPGTVRECKERDVQLRTSQCSVVQLYLDRMRLERLATEIIPSRTRSSERRRGYLMATARTCLYVVSP